jgi:hypothetical protein
MKTLRLSGIYAAVERRGKRTISCYGIALFGEDGSLMGEEKGGSIEWRTNEGETEKVKRLILKHVNSGSRRIGIGYEVPTDRIFLVDGKTYSKVVKIGEARCRRRLGELNVS